jgi:hypothetical protein
MDTPGVVRPRVKIKRDPGVTVTLYMKEKTAKKLADIATKETRTLSQMGSLLIEEALQKRGVKL